MAICYKSPLPPLNCVAELAILQAPDGLGNPRETKTLAIGNRAGKWSITTVQIGNNFAHTLRTRAAKKSEHDQGVGVHADSVRFGRGGG